jgi:hypothetical protein
MRHPRTTLTAVLPALTLTMALGAGCAESTTTQAPATNSETTTVPTTSPTSSRSTDDPKETSPMPMKIQITIADQQFSATLGDTAATRDLAAQLPVTVDMVDHGGVEKTGPLTSPLSVDGEPEGADPEVGAVGYYTPGNDLVLYYGDQSYFPGIVVLGRLDGDAAARIAELDGPVTATVEAR